MLDRCPSSNDLLVSENFFQYAANWGKDNGYLYTSFGGFYGFRDTYNLDKRQALNEFYRALWAKVDAHPYRMSDYWGFFLEPFLWSSKDKGFRGFEKLNRELHSVRANSNLRDFLQNLGVDQGALKQHLALLLSLTVNTGFVERVLLELEYLLVEKKLTKGQLHQFLLDYLSRHGFTYVGELARQKPSAFRKTIAKGVV